MGKNQPDADHENDKGRQDGDDQEDNLEDDDEEGSDDSGKSKKAKGSSREEQDDEESDDDDLSDWDPKKVKGYVKNLRKENARYRKDAQQTKTELADLRKQFTGIQQGVAKALGLKEGEDLSPEEQAEALQGHLGATQFQKAVLEAAYGFGVPPDNLEYFEYLVQKKASSLEEGEELSEDDLQDLAKRAKSSAASGKKGASTSVFGKSRRSAESDEGDGDDESDDDDSEPPPSKGSKGLTAERFAEMGTIEKTNLAAKNPALYDRLMSEARRKRLINNNF